MSKASCLTAVQASVVILTVTSGTAGAADLSELTALPNESAIPVLEEYARSPAGGGTALSTAALQALAQRTALGPTISSGSRR
jgi:hypothetical protein